MITTLTENTTELANDSIAAALIGGLAIDILKDIEPGETLTPGPTQDQWNAALDQLNRARVTLDVKTSWVAGEYRYQRRRPEKAARFRQELAEMEAAEKAGEEEA